MDVLKEMSWDEKYFIRPLYIDIWNYFATIITVLQRVMVIILVWQRNWHFFSSQFHGETKESTLARNF